MHRIVIDATFNGPPGSAHGGYACGVVASFIGAEAEVTLRAPPPLDVPLDVVSRDEGVEVRNGDLLVAEGRAVVLDLDVPEPVSFADATSVTPRFIGQDEHYFPTCFVCGTARAPDDGLLLHPGPVDDRDVVAAPWVPAPWTAGPDGEVRPEIVWAALDCPSAWTYRGPIDAPIVLGRLTAALRAPIRAGERIVSVSWPIGGEGRKYEAGSALVDEHGQARALSRAVWIALRR